MRIAHANTLVILAGLRRMKLAQPGQCFCDFHLASIEPASIEPCRAKASTTSCRKPMRVWYSFLVPGNALRVVPGHWPLAAKVDSGLYNARLVTPHVICLSLT